jgi:hypothetical protein
MLLRSHLIARDKYVCHIARREAVVLFPLAVWTIVIRRFLGFLDSRLSINPRTFLASNTLVITWQAWRQQQLFQFNVSRSENTSRHRT